MSHLTFPESLETGEREFSLPIPTSPDSNGRCSIGAQLYMYRMNAYMPNAKKHAIAVILPRKSGVAGNGQKEPFPFQPSSLVHFSRNNSNGISFNPLIRSPSNGVDILIFAGEPVKNITSASRRGRRSDG